jgi:hypothetical protein
MNIGLIDVDEKKRAVLQDGLQRLRATKRIQMRKIF